MHKFNRRYYRNIFELLKDLGLVVHNPPILVKLLLSSEISHAFRERLMLVVTAANRCRYCARFHRRVATTCGLTKEDVDLFLSGVVDHCPETEYVALGYAQNWAENNGVPEPDILSLLLDQYGEQIAMQINVILRLIRIGNLLGNSFDFILFRLSAGRLGNK